MARTARIKSRSGVYHIVLRGINKQTIFYDDEDKEVFINRMKLVKEKYEYVIYAFCFMSNHIHLLIKEKERPIGEIMRRILSSYVFWYNSKYERVGNLFQDRYKSEAIENDEYLLCAVRYIHQNPVHAKIIESPELYKWSSYAAYINGKDSIIETELVLSILQGEEQYIKFMADVEENKFIEPTEHFKISDDKLLKEIKRLLKITDVSELYLLSRDTRNESISKILKIKGSNPFQISRVTGISMKAIRTIMT